jgi:hypothetical protein
MKLVMEKNKQDLVTAIHKIVILAVRYAILTETPISFCFVIHVTVAIILIVFAHLYAVYRRETGIVHHALRADSMQSLKRDRRTLHTLFVKLLVTGNKKPNV